MTNPIKEYNERERERLIYYLLGVGAGFISGVFCTYVYFILI